ncbi:MAG: glycosyltransferase family 4 protein [Deltaproteobacteria bacterium]|nr:glycosyltransferase family 4 protein [Deltaproteobacteria bacterium]
MHILFLTDNFPPEVNAPACRTFEHCREWVKAGQQVTVITCAPNFPKGEIYQGYRNRLWQTEVMAGIRVIRVWTYITANEGFLKRSLDYFSYALPSFFAGLFVKSDVIIATSPQLFTTFSAYAISKVKRRPWIFELRDLWPESIRTVGAIEHRRVLDFLEKIAIFMYRNCTRVVALTPAFKQKLLSMGIASDKVDVITNGANLDLFFPRQKDEELLKHFDLEGKFVAAYIGTHGMAHNLALIVKSISSLQDKSIHFLFVGDGAEKKNIVQLAADLAVSNVNFIDPVAKEQVVRYLSLADVALVPLKNADTFKTVIPSKIFEAAAMEKPILLGVEGQAKEIVEEYRTGLCFEPENEKDFLDKLVRMKTDRELYQGLQQGCKKLVKAFDRKRLAEEMLEVIRKLGPENR